MARDGHGAFGFAPIFILVVGLLSATPLLAQNVKGGNRGDESKSVRWMGMGTGTPRMLRGGMYPEGWDGMGLDGMGWDGMRRCLLARGNLADGKAWARPCNFETCFRFELR